MSQWKQGKKIIIQNPVQKTQVKGRQLDLASLTSSHGTFSDFPYSRSCLPIPTHFTHTHTHASLQESAAGYYSVGSERYSFFFLA